MTTLNNRQATALDRARAALANLDNDEGQAVDALTELVSLFDTSPTTYPWPTTDAERETFRDWLAAVENQETTQGWRDWAADQTVTTTTTCRHCGRAIGQDTEGAWVDPEATSDDRVWRETCDQHDTFTAEHEPDPLDVPLGDLPHGTTGTPVQELLVRLADDHHNDPRSPACDGQTTLRDWREAMPELATIIDGTVGGAL